MKKSIYIVGLLIIILGSYSCTKKESEVNFKDQDKYTIYGYIVAHKENFSSFLSIVDKGGISEILNAYNPYADGYTLFLPDNKAIDKFIQQSGKYTSLDDLLNDTEYVSALCRYHTVRKAIKTDDFPFGAFSSYTLSGDLLTVSFISETDTSYYKINNQAPVTQPNIKASNGFIHVISSVLTPITYTTYTWLEQNQGYSIFKAAVEITGLKAAFDINIKDKTIGASPFTLLVEHDTVFNKRKIFSLQDLENLISPNNTDYTNPLNPLYNFIAYHMLVGNNFLTDFEKHNTNYATLSDIPLRITDMGLYLAINKGSEVFDTIVNGSDSTFIDFIGFNYDASNVLTQSGVIHFIDQVMTQKPPSIAIQDYQFFEEPLFNKFSQIPGTYLVEDSTALKYIKYSGADLFYVTGESSSTAWNGDYLMINGDFTISYTIPKIVQGVYKVYLRANGLNSANAIIQVFIDGKNIGGQINLTNSGTTGDPFQMAGGTPDDLDGKPLGEFTFVKYEQHTIVIKSLIPGRFLWDEIRFKPKL